MTTTDFSQLSLNKAMLENLESLGYQQMTAIQAQSLPLILAGKDVIAKAKTGSGKTAAFGIGLLAKLNVQRFAVQCLVLCPTRELADQVSKEIRRLARATHNVKVLTLCGGMPFGPQLGSLEHGAHIVVGTPGRIHEHLRKRSLRLDQLNTLVLDEADRMLDMGFEEAINAVVEQLPEPRQTLLFSATYPDSIAQMSAHFQYKPVLVNAESVHSEAQIEQHFYQVDKGDKLSALCHLFAEYPSESTVVFCNTKNESQRVADALLEQGYSALALHGDLEQRERDQVLVRFANRSCSILVATDVAARGIDIKDLSLVVNYDVTRDAEVHVHRIGRTGRAGQKGVAISLFTHQEAYRLTAIEEYLQMEISADELPDLRSAIDAPKPAMVTLAIDGGRKNKIRPGDILGALTAKAGVAGSEVGKIDIFDFCSYVAVKRAVANKALKKLQQDKLKGRNVKVRKLR
jgi:ATP-independent RNA helicase DbpA